MSLPTARTYLGVHRVKVYCQHCRNPRHRMLDLQKLIDVGHGDTPLTELPLRCIECGKRGHGIVVIDAWRDRPVSLNRFD
jgi:hypothetical protein